MKWVSLGQVVAVQLVDELKYSQTLVLVSLIVPLHFPSVPHVDGVAALQVPEIRGAVPPGMALQVPRFPLRAQLSQPPAQAELQQRPSVQ